MNIFFTNRGEGQHAGNSLYVLFLFFVMMFFSTTLLSQYQEYTQLDNTIELTKECEKERENKQGEKENKEEVEIDDYLYDLMNASLLLSSRNLEADLRQFDKYNDYFDIPTPPPELS